jgi:hypothetical protein
VGDGWEGRTERGKTERKRRDKREGRERLQIEVEMRDRVASKWDFREGRPGSGWTRLTIGREGAPGGVWQGQALVGSFLLGTMRMESEVLSRRVLRTLRKETHAVRAMILYMIYFMCNNECQ